MVFLQYFLAPLITALIIFIAQFFLLPKLEKNKTAQVELWKEKKDVFIQSIELIDRRYQCLSFGGKKGDGSVFNEPEKVNKIYTKLLILSENPSIPKKFWRFFDNLVSKYTPAERGEFILLLQKELGQKNNTKPENIPYFK